MLWEAFVEIIPRLPADMFASLIVRIIPGFFLGSLVGIILGILMGTSKVVRAITDPIVEILRPLPPLALIPLLILWFGIGNMTQILLIAFGSFIILVVTTVEAVRNIPPIYIQAAYTLGATPRQVFRRVMIPAIIPDIFGGIRVAAAASFGYDVAAELMGAPSGLGYLLIIARRFLNTDTIIVVMVIITLLSFLADQSIRRLNNYLTRWKPRL